MTVFRGREIAHSLLHRPRCIGRGGIAVGYACHELWPDPQTAKTVAGYVSLFTDVFLRLIKMIITAGTTNEAAVRAISDK